MLYLMWLLFVHVHMVLKILGCPICHFMIEWALLLLQKLSNMCIISSLG